MSTRSPLDRKPCVRCGGHFRRDCACGCGACVMCHRPMRSTQELRAHLNKIAPGFYVYFNWRKRSMQYEAFVFVPNNPIGYSGYGDDREEAEQEALLEAVGHLDSGFLLAQSDSESVSSSL